MKDTINMPCEAYSGTEPYIFVSYSHKDYSLVYPQINWLHKHGYRIWYDEGIDSGKIWTDEIANALIGCSHFLVLITPNAVASKNVVNEINYALNRDKPFIAIFLEETTLPVGLELRMGNIQAIMAYCMPIEQYQLKLKKTLAGAHDDTDSPQTGNLNAAITECKDSTINAPVTAATPNNLPTQLTSFIGREKEIASITELISTNRIVTLLGPGGIGKTRLSLQVANNLLSTYPDGVWFINLAPVTTPEQVISAIASALQISQESKNLQMMVINFLKSKTAMLIMDNCEQVIDSCAEIAEELLTQCPYIKIITTSREGLRCSGEQLFPVPTLCSIDDVAALKLDEICENTAVRLFLDRAKAVSPDFTVTSANAFRITKLCSSLDGIPLAIELAAARVNSLSIDQITAKLDDRFRLLTGGRRTAPKRQQTLKALIDWSYDLLSPAEQSVFRRMGIYVGSASLESIEAVCVSEEVSANDVFEIISMIIDKSLIIAEKNDNNTRYRMLETIREYAVERLREVDEEDIARERYLEWVGKYLLNEEHVMVNFIPDEKQKLMWKNKLMFNYEKYTITSILPWALLRPVGDTWRWAANIMIFGSYEVLSNESLIINLYKDIYLHRMELSPLANFYLLYFLSGNVDSLKLHLEFHAERVEIAKEFVDKRFFTSAIIQYARSIFISGDIDKAIKMLEETEMQINNDVVSNFELLHVRSTILFYQANWCETELLSRRAFELSKNIDMHSQSISLLDIACAIYPQCKLNEAEALGWESKILYYKSRLEMWFPICERLLGDVARQKDDLVMAIQHYRGMLKQNICDMNIDSKMLIPPIERMAIISSLKKDYIKTANLFGLATQLREETEFRIFPMDSFENDPAEKAAREAIGDEAYDKAFVEGRTWDVYETLEREFAGVPYHEYTLEELERNAAEAKARWESEGD